MPRGENRHSVLLSPDENEQVFSLIGPKCQSLATAVVQLYTTEGPAHSEWKKRDTGVLCLIKDNGRRSYFFRIYCLYRKTMIWEHEVYMQIEYKSPRPYLHTFEAEEYMTAFNFASEEDAIILRNVLLEKIEQRKSGQRSQKRRQKSMGAARPDSQDEVQLRRPNGSLPPPPAAPRVTEPEPTPVPTPLKTINSNTNKLKSSKRRGKIKITKADIGKPQNFQHISHVGWDANKGFDVETLQPQSEELRSFFSKAGVSEKQLRDQATREFIYSFIEINGGLDAVKEDLHTNQIKPQRSASNRVAGVGCSPSPPAMPLPAPPVPARSPAPTHPPAPPSRTPPPPPPSRAVPPPPPPVAVAQRNPPPPRPLQPPSSIPPSVPPPPPPGSAPPPPPPPPPAPAPPPPPAAPPMPEPEDSAVPTDMRAALMASIRNGSKTLKRVEVNKPAADDSRSNLLSEIRQGVELKSVSRSESNTGTANRPVAAAPVCGLAGALARALQERSRAIHSDSDDMSDETTSDGEWDD